MSPNIANFPLIYTIAGYSEFQRIFPTKYVQYDVVISSEYNVA